ncbi:hypothetical protein DE146DRAFT_682332 [Phaeosphaeria sp. MPI-PUGE-AT-0046c]|nr:hypothetical protein DE146DRAFT_682332 [Phaeosphaeria sp. MPI-PUGE-AT-0046c]
MYITSDLFQVGGDAARLHCNDTTPAYWTAMSDASPMVGLGKRKRLEGEQDPSAVRAHQQGISSPSHRYHNKTTSITITTPPPCNTTDRRPAKQMKRLSPKAALTKSTSHLMELEPDLSKHTHDTHAHSYSVSNLRPCHACNSAPRRKKDLENYLDCLRCDGRTCFICARQCFGGCGKAVCNKCIVEVGEDGDPWCLDCYSQDINS